MGIKYKRLIPLLGFIVLVTGLLYLYFFKDQVSENVKFQVNDTTALASTSQSSIRLIAPPLEDNVTVTLETLKKTSPIFNCDYERIERMYKDFSQQSDIVSVLKRYTVKYTKQSRNSIEEMGSVDKIALKPCTLSFAFQFNTIMNQDNLETARAMELFQNDMDFLYRSFSGSDEGVIETLIDGVSLVPTIADSSTGVSGTWGVVHKTTDSVQLRQVNFDENSSVYRGLLKDGAQGCPCSPVMIITFSDLIPKKDIVQYSKFATEE